MPCPRDDAIVRILGSHIPVENIAVDGDWDSHHPTNRARAPGGGRMSSPSMVRIRAAQMTVAGAGGGGGGTMHAGKCGPPLPRCIRGERRGGGREGERRAGTRTISSLRPRLAHSRQCARARIVRGGASSARSHPLILPAVPWGLSTAHLAGGRTCI